MTFTGSLRMLSDEFIKHCFRTPEIGPTQAFDCIRQIDHLAMCCQIEKANGTDDTESLGSGSFHAAPVVHQEEMSFDQCGQEDCELLSVVKTANTLIFPLSDVDIPKLNPAGRVCNPLSDCTRCIRGGQFVPHRIGQIYFKKELLKQIDLLNQ